ncbi:SusD/RagB family nutrient-binding outer membrane lipoprotein [Mucilaginibacter phyllosphaerae]|uniref:SusD/RagB family nutrient-binding outer membrane lipoprotein n=1 Tax=Mucilaginibacter phyllosphaerae TaxID=1812349 RepID=A0A4Y8AB53_9SPHI|nr:SusD/RagB family nutrient-binding outer membrane lipoprotein [Mucilaginibacter phyllosphaerae]MBB3969503.1 hypothetical protein [Mucilaginibacter phyllosphaerae]TEW65720.1 SusD/RagB family nutrient-binding outer membrane lipoprotein [Mucilaginibacter phyllosphaerae]GGH09007.1 hypothetical protein GCM10007352_14310 [Mucilaginibacter phyllosphaerae]
MKKIYICFALLLVITGSCKKVLDINNDPNNPNDVQEPLLLAPIELNISDQIYAGNASTIVQNFMQVIAANQPNPGLWNYQLFNIDMDGDWYNFYVNALNNLRILDTKATAKQSYNYAAIAKILSAYTLGTATDIWGDIPYSEALKGSNNLTPTYDKQEDIYKAVQALLDNGIADINKNSITIPGGDDYFYKGDMVKWKKLAYTLKARYYMHLAKAPGYTAAAQADLVLNALNNGMASNDDDLTFKYTGSAGGENTINLTFSPVTTYVLNSTYVNGFKSRNDPRLTKIIKPAASTNLYNGRTIGEVTGDLSTYSYPADFYAGAESPNYIMNFSEALFLKAEALFIKSGAATAQPVYQAAVKSNLAKLAVSDADAATYLSQRGTLTATNAIQLIMEEKSIANFFNIENFTDWRRTGYPAINKVNGALSEIPRRLLYPQSEILTNARPQQSAKLTDRLWWDVQ